MILNGPNCSTVIQNCSDAAAYQSNIIALEGLNSGCRYRHVIAWGKFLGFTPATVNRYLSEAEADEAPYDCIQKINGRWLRLDDIVNESNRRRVTELAKHAS